jgi:hypothetical protein
MSFHAPLKSFEFHAYHPHSFPPTLSFFKMPGALQAAPFIALGLLLVTLPHHWRVRNIAILSIIAWLSAYNLMYGVGAVIWDGNDEIRATVWCDIGASRHGRSTS